MFCHGELARSRPAPSRLTHFYLAVSAGGVVGGALVALGAPALLNGYFEVEIGLVLLAAAVLWRSWGRAAWWAARRGLVLVGSRDHDDAARAGGAERGHRHQPQLLRRGARARVRPRQPRRRTSAC